MHKDTISAEELLSRITPENNAITASRMPPGMSCGLHPSGFYDVYKQGGLFEVLKEELGAPLARPTLAFGGVAGSSVSPDNKQPALENNNTSLNPTTWSNG